nr:MAG TPA: hypothetical protein [Caudoviricetes sp.]
MKFEKMLNESSVSSAYASITSKIKADISNVSKALKIDEDDMYENPKAAKEFWVSFFEDMENLQKLLYGYYNVLGEIDNSDDIYNKCDLEQIEKKFIELSRLLSKKIDAANSNKVLK